MKRQDPSLAPDLHVIHKLKNDGLTNTKIAHILNTNYSYVRQVVRMKVSKRAGKNSFHYRDFNVTEEELLSVGKHYADAVNEMPRFGRLPQRKSYQERSAEAMVEVDEKIVFRNQHK